MGRKTTDKEYRARFKTIATFIDYKLPKRGLTRAEKQRVTKTYRAIAAVIRGGGAVVRSKSRDRVKKANKIAGLHMSGLKVAFVRNTPSGSKISLDKHGQAIEKIGKIRRLTLEAVFFDIPDLTDDPDEEERIRKLVRAEAKRLTKLSRNATAYAVKYASGGEGQTFAKELLEQRLVMQQVDDKYNASAAPVGIVAYWFPKKDIKLVIEIKDKQKQRRKKAKKRW